MAFEVFTSYGAAAREEATLRASGYLFLSKNLLRRIEAEHSEHVILLYDAETSRLGVRAALPNDPADQKRAVSAEASGSAVNIAPVLRYYRLSQPPKKVKLDASIENRMLVIDMKPINPAMDKEGQDLR